MRIWVCVLGLIAGVAVADIPASSKRPVGRPGTTANGMIRSVEPALDVRTLPRGGLKLTVSLRPQERTRAVRRAVRRAQNLRVEGAVCGDPAIQGDVVGQVPGRLPGCGVANAVRVRSVSNVGLSQPSVMDCGTAQALKQWVDGSVKPGLRRMGGGVKSLRVAAHYACRTRNNRPGARISEHGKGRAIDVSGFRLNDGTTITVLKGWTSPASRQALRRMHREACGPFGTVLGPNADRYHRDHFHFDTARYRNGTYCR